MSYYRLEAIASFVKGKSIIDVGADHGELEVLLSKKDNVSSILAVENKKGPFNNLVNKIKEANLTKVTASYSNGLDDINNEIDTIIIAGMGGYQITNILMDGKYDIKNVKYLVLAPQGDHELVRRVVSTLSFEIKDELVVIENKKTYVVMYFERVEHAIHYKDNEYEYGLSGYSEKKKDLSIMNLKDSDSDLLKKKIRRIKRNEDK